ncbi:hypothetical protein KGF56_000379 [Candida oxycetoniae]|uniref:Uncharacterized protein n=1 Tax=Candida oxycetoniae TaxID=497107 RepID=A0AAI9X060_9ASCO|nr:uncharacterized protein KGF56_000379 [Candida oxycetoniae]KAI3406774.1 hypothetical protein KGF56_000379 [Candida oxycetoniae]
MNYIPPPPKDSDSNTTLTEGSSLYILIPVLIIPILGIFLVILGVTSKGRYWCDRKKKKRMKNNLVGEETSNGHHNLRFNSLHILQPDAVHLKQDDNETLVSTQSNLNLDNGSDLESAVTKVDTEKVYRNVQV